MMGISIEELNRKLSSARASFLGQIRLWLSKQAEQSTYEKWEQALQTESLDEFVSHISRLNLFTCSSSSEVDDAASFTSEVRRYQFILHDNSSMMLEKLCCLSNLYLQLLQSIALIKPLEPMPDLKAMELARVMAVNVNEELALLEKRQESFQDYQPRLEKVKGQLAKAQKEMIEMIIACQNESIAANHQLRDVLPLLINTVFDAWQLEKDERYLTSFRALMPWHGLIMALAQNVLGPEKVLINARGKLEIQGQWSGEVCQLMEAQRILSVSEFKERHNHLVQLTKCEIEKSEAWLSSIPKSSAAHEARPDSGNHVSYPDGSGRSNANGFFAYAAARAGVVSTMSVDAAHLKTGF